jgi:carbamoyltransferase
MLILGLNAFHADAAACIYRDATLLGAAEEERFRRVKHWAGFPSDAIAFCLQEARATLADVDVIAINTDPSAARWRRIGYALAKRPSLALIAQKLRSRRQRLGVAQYLQRDFPRQEFKGKIVPVEHHLAHLASAYYASPFIDALAVSIDGFGDFASGAYGIGQGDNLRLHGHVWFPHSLGIFYQAITQYLGFPNYGDEYKVMGLAPYGKPRFLAQMRELVGAQADGAYALQLPYFKHHTEATAHSWDGGSPIFNNLFTPKLEELLGPKRLPGAALEQAHKDMATSAQAMFEEATFAWLSSLHAAHPVNALALAGGCAANSVANGKLTRNTPFKKIYVAANTGDAGGAIGAAIVAARSFGVKRPQVMRHGYWGTHFSNEDCAIAIADQRVPLQEAGCTMQRIDDFAQLCKRVVDAIIQGGVIGWFQGRMEWGPRALGNRSILADPRRADMKDILNAKIKRRESFRPFAPSILREHVAKWFEIDADVPFMSEVFPILEAKRSLIPAVAHVDGSGRLQTVEQTSNPRYYQLIETFLRATGVPILLNTSFNENEPVVCKPGEALACFVRTKMDVLVMQDWLIERPSL